MGVTWNPVFPAPVLSGRDGELLMVRIRIPSSQLESLLDSLAELPFPINPELHHGFPESTVEFPAYASQKPEIRRALNGAGLPDVNFDASPMLATLTTPEIMH